MSWVETKYINLIGHRLERFKQIGRDTWNFRCPYCGDSHKRKHRRRGYFYTEADVVWFKCHNCGITKPFGEFLRDNCPEQYKPYLFEIFGKPAPKDRSEETDNPAAFKVDMAGRFGPKVDRAAFLKDFPKMSSLGLDNPGVRYLASRRIPPEFLRDLYWVADGSVFSDILPDYADRRLPNHPAIGIPFWSKDGALMFFQLRYIGDNVGDLRYMTLEVSGGMKVWGLDRIDWTKPVDVLEGAFDAMFVENSIAVAGADIIEVAQYVKDQGAPGVRLIWDADFSSNKDVRARLTKAVERGFPVVLFEKGSLSGKDINDAIKNDVSVDRVRDIVNARTFSGLDAKLALSQFRKPTENRKYNANSTKKKSKADFHF